MSSSCPPPAKTSCDSKCISQPVVTSLTWTQVPNVGAGVYPDGLPNNNPVVQINTSCAKFKKSYCKLNATVRLILSITTLQLKKGATLSQIVNQHNNVICSSKPLTIDQAKKILAAGVSKGIFFYLKQGIYYVNTHFGSLPSNQELIQKLGPNYLYCLGILRANN